MQGGIQEGEGKRVWEVLEIRIAHNVKVLLRPGTRSTSDCQERRLYIASLLIRWER